MGAQNRSGVKPARCQIGKAVLLPMEEKTADIGAQVAGVQIAFLPGGIAVPVAGHRKESADAGGGQDVDQIVLRAVGAAVVEAVPAFGDAVVVRDDAARGQAVDGQLGYIRLMGF